jgi:hypothetical protein
MVILLLAQHKEIPWTCVESVATIVNRIDCSQPKFKFGCSPTQTLDVHSVQSTNPKSNQQKEAKKKQWNNKVKGDKNDTNIFGGGKMENKKLKYLCNLVMENHLNHLYPRLAEAPRLLAQQ